MALIKLLTRSAMAGLFFCLVSAEGARLLFLSCYNAAQYKRLQRVLCRPCTYTTNAAKQSRNPPAHTRYQRRAGRCAGQHSCPIIIRYIRVCPCYGSIPDGAAYRRPCQPGGVSMFPTPGISLAPGQPGIVLSSWHGRRGTIDGFRRNSFRAFARQPIEVSNSRSVPAGIVVTNSRSFSNKIVVEQL